MRNLLSKLMFGSAKVPQVVDEHGELQQAPESNNTQDGLGSEETRDYWTGHNVTNHYLFSNASESLEFFDWRNDQYYGYIDLMPVAGQDERSVLDFGCGPGHDLVGFGVYSKPARLVGVDLSESSLQEAGFRLGLHSIDAELVRLPPTLATLPFPDGSLDYIHSSGVLHHTPDPISILREFHRVLKPGGTARVMVYNYYSLWVHLYVAYQRTLIEGLYSEDSLGDRFRRSTDGEDCPISDCYRPDEWIAICNRAGFSAEFTGAAVSIIEMGMLNSRFAAIQDRRLPSEHRKFLLGLTFDTRGYPLFEGHYAGIDGCYLLRRD